MAASWQHNRCGESRVLCPSRPTVSCPFPADGACNMYDRLRHQLDQALKCGCNNKGVLGDTHVVCSVGAQGVRPLGNAQARHIVSLCWESVVGKREYRCGKSRLRDRRSSALGCCFARDAGCVHDSWRCMQAQVFKWSCSIAEVLLNACVAQSRRTIPFRFADRPRERICWFGAMRHHEDHTSSRRRSLAWLAQAVTVAQAWKPWVTGRNILPKIA